VTFVAELLYPDILLQVLCPTVEMGVKPMILKRLFLFYLGEKNCTDLPPEMAFRQ
jgi:hypothetical protein